VNTPYLDDKQNIHRKNFQYHPFAWKFEAWETLRSDCVGFIAADKRILSGWLTQRTKPRDKADARNGHWRQ
jgi:hypothetical protein